MSSLNLTVTQQVKKLNLTVVQNGHVVTIQPTISVAGVGGGSSTLVGLTDTDISSPNNGEALVYNSTTSKWENSAVITDIDGGTSASIYTEFQVFDAGNSI
jgi:hypothetical protein